MLLLALHAVCVAGGAAGADVVRYTLADFTAAFGPALGHTDPKRDPSHEDFDHYLPPMPKLKPEVAPAVAFSRLDQNDDQIVDMEEFTAIFALEMLEPIEEGWADKRGLNKAQFESFRANAHAEITVEKLESRALAQAEARWGDHPLHPEHTAAIPTYLLPCDVPECGAYQHIRRSAGVLGGGGGSCAQCGSPLAALHKRVFCSGRRSDFRFFADRRGAAHEFCASENRVRARRRRRLGEIVYQLRRRAL